MSLHYPEPGQRTVTIEDLEAMLDLYTDPETGKIRPLLTRKTPEERGAGPSGIGDLHHDEYWSDGQPRHSTDIEAMRYQGSPGMNEVFMAHMGSSLSRSDTVADTIERIVEAASRNCADDPDRSRWRNNLGKKATSWLEKHPEWLCTALEARHYDTWLAAQKKGRKPKLIWKTGDGLRTGNGLEVRTYPGDPDPHPADSKT